jgi:hypothetical protein
MNYSNLDDGPFFVFGENRNEKPPGLNDEIGCDWIDAV